MNLFHEVLAFFAFNGPYILIGVLAIIAVWVATLVTKRIKRPSSRFVAWPMVAVMAFFAPFVDEIVGRIYLNHLCGTEAGVKVYQTVELPAEYWDEQGRPRFIAANGFVDTKLLPSRYGWDFVNEPYWNFVVKIEKSRAQFADRETKQTLGEKISYRRQFGWIINNFSPASHGGVSCRNLGLTYNRDESVRRGREEDLMFFLAIFKLASLADGER